MTVLADADRLWHPWLRIERVTRELLMNHASERRFERQTRAELLEALTFGTTAQATFWRQHLAEPRQSAPRRAK